MINKKIQNFSFIEIFLIVSYTICWFSISTSFYDIYNFAEKKNANLNELINFLRQSLNLIIFPILIIFFLKNLKSINFKNELLFISALAYFLFQIPGLLFTENSFTNVIYVISALNILFIFTITNIYFDRKKYLIFFYITLFMLFLITILNYKTFVNFLYSESSSTLYTFFNSSETFFGKQSPRSTGSSRTLLLIMLITFLIFYKFFEKNNFLKNTTYILISTFILLFQSRTTIVLLITFILINYIYEKNFSIKETLKYLIIYILMPIIFLYSILIFKYFIHNKDILKNLDNQNLNESFFEITDNFQRPIDINTYSSGRVEDWKSILKKMPNSKIIGYGSQGDRFLIDQSASNGIIYAIASSGFVGLIFYIILSIFSFLILIKNFLPILKSNQLEFYYCSIVVLLLLLRSILESSYAVFSVDFIVFYTFLNYLNKFLKNIKNEN